MSLENFSKGQGDSAAGGGAGAAPLSGMFCQLMQEGLKDIFKKAGGGGGGGDPFNFSHIGEVISKEISENLGGKK